MRVIAGSARSLPLRTVRSMKTRPTQDRIKETLFNILMPEIPGSRFLDLFAGSGAIGIEALSRGAEHAVFVEKDRDALSCIRYNLQFTRLNDRAEVLGKDVFAAIRELSLLRAAPFDLIFMDPPYEQGLEAEALRLLKGSGLLHRNTLLIVEASLKTNISDLEAPDYRLVRQKKYKTNQHVFLVPASSE